MLWIVFTFLAAGIWTSVDLFSKFVMSKEVKDPVISTGVAGVSLFFSLTLISYLMADLTLSPGTVVPSAAVGVFYSLGLLAYYSGIEKEDVSRFIPTLSTTTIFTVLLAFFFVGESFSLVVYAGIASVVIGAVLISLKGLDHFQSLLSFSLAIISAFAFAVRNIFLKVSTGGASLWTVLMWAGIGGSVTSLFFLLRRGSKLKEATKGEEHLIVIGLISALGYFAYGKAISLGPVSLASTVLKVKILLVFLSSTVISRLHPDIIYEELDRYTLAQKVLAIILIVFGVVLIQLFS